MKTRILSLILCIALMIPMLALVGCRDNDDVPDTADTADVADTEDVADPGDADEPADADGDRDLYTIRWFLAESTNQWNEDPIFQYVQERFNVEFDFIGPAWPDQIEQMRMMMMAMDMPDVAMTLSLFDDGNDDVQQWVQEDFLLDLTDLIPNYSNLAAYVQSNPTFDQAMLDGRWYALPRYLDGVWQHGLQIRRDWIDELGLEVPTTLDELHEVLAAIVEADPDGTNPIGLSTDNWWWFTHLQVAYTGVFDWGYVDGRYRRHYTLDSFRDFLVWLNNLYAEGLVDPDFVLGMGHQSQEKMMAGRVVIMNFNTGSELLDQTITGLEANFPHAVLEIIPPLAGPAGQFAVGMMNDIGGVNVITTAAEQPERILEILDFLASEEGYILARYGIEGVHYEVDANGEFVRNEEQIAADEAINPGIWSRSFHHIRMLLDYAYTDPALIGPPVPRYYMLGPAMQELLALPQARQFFNHHFTSQNARDFGPAVADVSEQWFIAFVTGERDPIADWDEYIEALRDAGYFLIEDDLNEWMSNIN